MPINAFRSSDWIKIDCFAFLVGWVGENPQTPKNCQKPTFSQKFDFFANFDADYCVRLQIAPPKTWRWSQGPKIDKMRNSKKLFFLPWAAKVTLDWHPSGRRHRPLGLSNNIWSIARCILENSWAKILAWCHQWMKSMSEDSNSSCGHCNSVVCILTIASSPAQILPVGPYHV